jgi:anti-sigma regulatory factor (Ser/Thr protein kinase)
MSGTGKPWFRATVEWQMTKRKGEDNPVHSSVPQAIANLLAASDFTSAGEVARVAHVTRQAAHYHLRQLVQSGDLVREGAGRATRYRLRADRTSTYELAGLEEDQLWLEEQRMLRRLDPDALERPNVRQILNFAVTEMANNAIDHSRGSHLVIRWFLRAERIAFEIEDDGVGVFRTLREARGLKDDFDAVGELSKGKQTSAPAQHSGLGIFYTSRMVDRFVLAGGQLIWTVDNAIHDTAISWLDQARDGTLVRCEIDRQTSLTAMAAFDELQVPGAPGSNRTRVHVALFRQGSFVSRSEAKRIAASLEGFDMVEVDFDGIGEIGQAFADELFRVWQHQHRSTDLVPINTNPAIDAMIALARQ